MRKLRIVGLILCFAMFLVSTAMLISNARGNVETDKQASLTLTYGYSGTPFKDQNIKIYRVANMIGNTTFTLDGDFYGLPVELNKVKSQGEWKEIASTLSAYVVSKGIVPTNWTLTDDNGNADFTNLKTGLYLVEGLRVELENGYCQFDSFMITLPGVDENEEWTYHVDAVPKSSFEEHEEKEVEYKINKLWKDEGNENKRPQSVEVELYKDGEFVEKVTLSSDNNWSYTWKSTEDALWTAVEKNVASGYTVTIERSGNSFFVTNTYDDPPPPPQTGDSSNVYLTVAIMSIAGALFLIIGMGRRKKGVV